MAIGDRTPTELIVPTALGITAVSVFANAAANFRTQMTGIWLCNTGATARVVSLFKNGTVAANQIGGSISLAAGASVIIGLDGKPLVFTGTQLLAAKQDLGTDVNIAAYGIVEQIA
jgi:hypothetical protein